MPSLIFLLTLTGLTGEWKTFTNTNYINDMAGTDSVLYLATTGGLQMFTVADTTFRETFTNADGLPINVLTCCATDRDGNIWIGTGGGGLVVFNRHREAPDLPARPDAVQDQLPGCGGRHDHGWLGQWRVRDRHPRYEH